MKAPFSIDGITYDVTVPYGGLRRSAAVMDGNNVGRSKSGDMIRDVIGTYYNYTLELDTQGLQLTEYDKLYEVLTAPVDSHLVKFPYGQTTLSFRAYISNAEDTLRTIDGGKSFWTGLTITFTAMSPQRRP